MTTTRAPTTAESIAVDLPDWVSPYAIEKPRWTYKYRTTPKPIYIGTYSRRPRTTRSSLPIKLQSTNWLERSTIENPVTQSVFKPLNPITVSTTVSRRSSTKQRTRAPTTLRTPTPKTTTTATTNISMPEEKQLRIQPGTILMMDSEYLKEKYIRPGLATTFHRALLADYFGLSENEMKRMGMTVVAWGFSYQVKDKATHSRGQNRAPKYFCDFKFRSSTFNAGYVGADINMGIDELDGLVRLAFFTIY